MTTDILNIDRLLSDEERAVRDRVRAFVDVEVRPNIADWFERAVFPRELIPGFAELGLLGMHLDVPGRPGRSSVEYGLAMSELEAGDSGLRTFVSVQGSLAMSAIAKHGSDEQRNEYLPGMSRGEIIGCFGLTEPGSGSDPGSMTTRAVRDGDDWVITGAKRWIGLASIADLAIIWAATDEGIRGFIVPTSATGFTATPIAPKLSMRASIQCDIELDAVRVPESARLPHADGLKGPFACLNEARYGIAWGVMGAARDSLEVALAYAGERMQFGKALSSFQLSQAKFADWAVAVGQGYLVALHLGRTKDEVGLAPAQISFGKLANTRAAIDIARAARGMLGGNGITLDYSPMRHAANLESVRTYEGTDEVHQLVLGQALTGIPAYRG